MQPPIEFAGRSPAISSRCYANFQPTRQLLADAHRTGGFALLRQPLAAFAVDSLSGRSDDS